MVEEIPICTLRMGEDLFGIETGAITEVLDALVPQRVPLAPRFIAGVVSHRGDALTTVSMRSLLGLEEDGGASCVMVFEGEGDQERFGLAVDAVLGVTRVCADVFEVNPSTLDMYRARLFDGACRTAAGLMVRLDVRQLSPARLAESRIFDETPPAGKGDGR